jgi:predicted Zn-ribbon and HTH transcriptional regulator
MVGPHTRYQPWTPAEDDQLHIMLDAGMRAEEIARKLKRTSRQSIPGPKSLRKCGMRERGSQRRAVRVFPNCPDFKSRE